MRARSFGLAAVVLALARVTATPALAGPANVTVRVEGDADTLVARTALTTTTATVNKDGMTGHDCTGTSAAGALEQATAGSWCQARGSTAWATPSTRSKARATRERPEFWGLFLNDQLGATRSASARTAGRRPGATWRRSRSPARSIQRAPRRGRAGHCDTGRRLLVTVTRTTWTSTATSQRARRRRDRGRWGGLGRPTAVTAARS